MKISKLNSFLEIEEEKKVLIFDFYNLAYRTVHVAHFTDPEDSEFLYWKYLMINSIFAALRQFKPNRVIMAIDYYNSWRKTIYPNYKANRHELKEKSKIDYKAFYKVLDEFIESFKNIFKNIYCLRLENVEGDDIIAVLCKEEMMDYKKIIISNDRDFIQLLSNKNIKLYNPKDKEFVQSLNPQMSLEIKILTGDKTDNIVAVKKKCGEKTAIKILETGLDIFLQNEEINKNYKINRQLIDFDYIPKDIAENIKNQFRDYKIGKISAINIMNWLSANKMMKFLEDLQSYYPFISNLK